MFIICNGFSWNKETKQKSDSHWLTHENTCLLTSSYRQRGFRVHLFHRLTMSPRDLLLSLSTLLAVGFLPSLVLFKVLVWLPGILGHFTREGGYLSAFLSYRKLPFSEAPSKLLLTSPPPLLAQPLPLPTRHQQRGVRMLEVNLNSSTLSSCDILLI